MRARERCTMVESMDLLNTCTASPRAKERRSLAVLTYACEELDHGARRKKTKMPAPNAQTLSIDDDARKTSNAHRPKCIDSHWRCRYRSPQVESFKIFG